MTEENVIDDVIENNNKAIRPNYKRAKRAELFIWLVMLLDIISFGSSYLQYDLLTSLLNNEEVTDQMLNSNDNREGVVGILYFIVYVIFTVVFIQWFRRAYYNLNVRTTCDHSEGWAAGCWFVPILSLFRPYQIMKEMWNKTDALIRSKSPDTLPVDNRTTIIGLWWTFWVISNVVGQYVFRIAFKSETIEAYINGTIADMILSVIGIPLAIITVLMVRSYALKEEEINQLEVNSF